MTALSVPLLSASAALILLIYKLIIYPVLLSPLAKIPCAHWSASFCPFWIQLHRIKHQNTFKVHEAHQKYGPIIRLAPNEISVNCIEGGLRTIYAGGYEKNDWYSNVFNNYGIEPMFCMEQREMHSRRKRMISNVYARSTLHKSTSLAAISHVILQEQLLPQLRTHADAGTTIDIYDVFAAATLDIVSAYAVGLKNSSHLVLDLQHAARFARNFKARQRYTVWPQDLPKFTAFVRRLGLGELFVPNDKEGVYDEIESMILRMVDGAEEMMLAASRDAAAKPEDYPTVYAQLRSGMIRAKPEAADETAAVKASKYEIASELNDHIIAGYDTSSITLTWLAWQLSRPQNAAWQKNLQQELQAMQRSVSSDLKTLDGLPILEAILLETLRLHAPIPGNQPRVTPANACLGPPGQEYAGLPAGVRVQAQAWSLHRNAEVFPEPEQWQPARWLDATAAQQKEMLRWFWAFGSGGRMCVGSNLATLDMKAIIATVWANFSTTIVFDEGMVPNGGYIAEPLGVNGRILEIRLTDI